MSFNFKTKEIENNKNRNFYCEEVDIINEKRSLQIFLLFRFCFLVNSSFFGFLTVD